MALDLIIKLEFPKLRAKLLKSNKENKKSNAKSETQGIKVARAHPAARRLSGNYLR